MSYVLRHAAGTPECPINEEGWVKWEDLRAHESCRRFGGWVLWEAVEADAKDRVIATPDEDGVWWVAAWSGHTQERVVGPAAIVPAQELPKGLTHGSYRRHTASIQKKGLLRRSRDIHFHDPESRTGKWRLDLETCVKVNVQRASEAGCVFRRTGNDVWLCDRDVPVSAIIGITEWDKPRDVPPSGMLFDLKKREEANRAGKGGSASSSAGSGDFNSAALDIPAYRPWQPKSRPALVTEEVASAAYGLGSNLPEGAQEGIEVDPVTGAVETRRLAACIAPGYPGEDDEECDWSADDSDVEVVMAAPASSSLTKEEKDDEEEEASLEIVGVGKKREEPRDEPMDEANSDMEVEKETGPSTTVKPEEPNAGEKAPDQTGETPPKKGVETLEPKAEEIHEEGPQPTRRRKIRFGSAHLHLLRAVADADAQNWESLQRALGSTGGSAKVKSELVERLEQLADLRVESLVAAEKSAQQHAERAKHYSEAETTYRSGLNEAMLRLEKMNPVGPRTSVPLVSEARLQREIEAGVPIWVARRAHRARERAARKRQGEPRTTMDTSQPSAISEVAPEEGGQILDDAFAASAKANLAEFKQVLKKEAAEEKPTRKRKPDSDRRKKIKKDRREERKRNSKDDADRDRNHAIAHSQQRSEASFSPGLRGALVATMVQGSQGFGTTREEDVSVYGEPLHREKVPEYLHDTISGMVFDLALMMFLVSVSYLSYRLIRWGCWRFFGVKKNNEGSDHLTPSSARRVGSTRKKVRFNIPRKAKTLQSKPDTPFLGGPRAASRRHPPGKALRLATVQGRHEFEQEGFALLLSRYSKSTTANYQTQWSWWSLFCRRRGLDPVRFVPHYERAEEQLILDYLVHCATNEIKAPGTIKLRLAAIRSMHLTLGYPDPLMHMPRVPLALAGLRRRYGTKERRMPVTPDMLKWLGEHLQFGHSQEASLLWGALTLGFFFLLRASEYLDVGYQDPNRGLRGSDITLKLNGKALGLERIREADEVVITVRGSKTDIYNRGQVRNHFKADGQVCVVKSMVTLFCHFPQRYQGGSEAEDMLFRSPDERPIPRAAIQALIERAAKGLGMPSGDLGTHSLRFGGASALWSQFRDTALVKRWGRWSSDSFQSYVWESREAARDVAQKMASADLTPN
eukprot:Skav210774  [mRNA]  locus=scaffold3765:57404:60835:+ [translate_table: standard]